MKLIENETVFTLITGSSSGLGKELAIEFANNRKNLILVALPGQDLNQLCEELEYSFGIRAVSLECDLTDEASLSEMVKYVISNFSINQLVNNAGIGGTIRFMEVTSEYLDKIIYLNIRATTMLTHMLLPKLMLHKKALIMNIASIAAFEPIPYKTIYPASKAFIYSFSRGLSMELNGTGVSVVVVIPGPIATNHDVTLRITNQGFLGKINLLTADKIARIAFSSSEKGKKVIIPGFFNKVIWCLNSIIPEFIRISFMEKIIRKELSNPNIVN